MSAHTPGPWEAKEPNGFGMGWRAGPAWLGIDPRSPETVANSRLIAAAPDLLAACIAYLADRAEAGCTADSAAVKSIRAAIAKATGDAS